MSRLEKTRKHQIKTKLESIYKTLLLDEAITMTLFAFSHIKDGNVQIETLKSVFSALSTWACSVEQKDEISSLVDTSPILQFGLLTIKKSESICPYSPN